MFLRDGVLNIVLDEIHTEVVRIKGLGDPHETRKELDKLQYALEFSMNITELILDGTPIGED